MIIKIKGKLTLERIESMLEHAKQVYGDSFDGFYSTSIYVTGYSKNGFMYDDKIEKTTLISQVPPGQIAKPAITDEGHRMIKEAHQKKIENEYKQNIKVSYINAVNKVEFEYRKKLSSINEAYKKQCEKIIAACAQEYADELNKVIDEKWAEHAPLKTIKNKEELLPKPFYSALDNEHLFFKSTPTSTPVKIVTPYLKVEEHLSKPYYANKFWVELVHPEIGELHKKFVERLGEELVLPPTEEEKKEIYDLNYSFWMDSDIQLKFVDCFGLEELSKY